MRSYFAIRHFSPAIWPQWRGPNRNGTTGEIGWTSQWNGQPPTAWQAKVGLGFSSIVVSEGKACTAGHAEGEDTVFCFDVATGKLLRKHSYPAELGDKYFEGRTTGTPTFDADRVYRLGRLKPRLSRARSNIRIMWSTCALNTQ